MQTAPGYLVVGNATIHDAHPEGMLTVAQVIQKSSNVGAAKIALALPRETLWNMFSGVGLRRVAAARLSRRGRGRLRAYQNWRPIEQATMSYGHGISVSLLQLARAYTVFATDGELQPLTLVAPRRAGRGQARDLGRHGAGGAQHAGAGGAAGRHRAARAGHGLSRRRQDRHRAQARRAQLCADQYVSSFVGFAPASDPRLLVAVMIDEPSAGQYYGGAVAAPVFSRVMAEALRMLASRPMRRCTDIVPVDALPEVREEV